MEVFFGVIIGLIILVLLVVVHELGHAIAAIRSGVVLEEFGVGFPPRAWSKKLANGVLVSLNWLPLGGFVKLQGEYDASSGKGDYGAASYLQKTKILLAGVAVNWVVAALLLSVLAVWTGIPNILPNQFFIRSDTTVITHPVEVVSISSDTPAERAGIEAGDVIRSIAGSEVSSSDFLIQQTESLKGEEVEIIYERNGVERVAQVRLNEEATPEKGYLGAGVGQQMGTIKTGWWSAPITGTVTTAQFSWATLVGIKDLAVNTTKGLIMRVSSDAETREEAKQSLGSAAESVAGPIGILGVIFPAAAKAGLANLVFLSAIISLTLAVMNILPIPALDGGRFATMTIFRVLKKPLTKEREEVIQAVGFMSLMGLIIIITITDIGKFF